MKLKIPVILIALILSTFVFHSFAYAEDTRLLVPPGVRDTTEDGALFSDDKMSQMKQDKDDATLTDGILLGFILSIFELKISSLPTLIFGNPYGDTENLDFGIFTKDEMSKIIDPMLAMLTGIYVTILTGAIMVSAARFGIRAYSPQAKSEFWTDINMWVLSAFFMACFWLIFKVMMSINVSLVMSISDLLKSNGVDTNGVSLVASAGNFNISNALVYLAEFGLTLYLNIIYIARKVIITFLVVLAPFAAYSMLFAKTRTFFGTWLKELAGNIFLQTIHSIAIYVLTMFASLASETIYGTIYKLGLLIMFIPITGMMSRWMNLGDSSSKMGQAATIAGVGSVAGAMMLAKGAGGMMGGRRGGSGPITYGNSSSGGDSAGTSGDYSNDSGTTALSKAASGGTGWQRMRSVAGKMGAVAGGTMGLIMGPAGVAVGAKAGSAIASKSAQGARNAFAGAANTSRTAASAVFPNGLKSSYQNAQGNGLFGKVQDMASTGGQNLKNTWKNLGERRRFMGNLGESVGSSVGAGGFGRQMGHMLSGASRGRVQAADSASGGMNNMDLPQLSKKYAGQNVSWEQTNSGSAFYVDTASGKQRISAFGAADPNLKKGETRETSYQFPGHNQKFERQPNGSYKLPSAQNAPSLTGGANNLDNPVGLPGGSSEHLARTSGAFIRGTDGAKYEDTRMDASKLSPDSYFAHNIKGADRRDWSDKGADFLSRNKSSNTRYTPPSNHVKKLEGMADQVKREKTRTKNKMVL